MTREEAKKWLKTFKVHTGMAELSQAFDVAIEALEPKPMQKFDNVKQHIDRLAGDYKCWDQRLSHEEALELSRMLEQESCEDAISRQAVLEKWENTTLRGRTEFDQVIMMIPSVTPQQNVGKWIETGETTTTNNGQILYKVVCSNCNVIEYFRKCTLDNQYAGAENCPHCLAKMEIVNNFKQGLNYADADTMMPAI